MNIKDFTFDGSKKLDLSKLPTGASKEVKEEKDKYLEKTQKNYAKMVELQDRMYSEAKEGIVVVLQAMDAAGKDSTVKHVFTVLNPAGVDVYPYKSPSHEELAHDFLWRCTCHLPQRGKIAVFNRSYYEDVLVVKVHKLYKDYKMAARCLDKNIIEKRYTQIKNFEDYLYENSYRTVKLFLNVSKDEQKERFLERIDQKIKNWKFSSADVYERGFWDEYHEAYEKAINATATKENPWYVIPADNKWYTRYLVSEAVLKTMEAMEPKYPQMPKEEAERLLSDREKLLAEK